MNLNNILRIAYKYNDTRLINYLLQCHRMSININEGLHGVYKGTTSLLQNLLISKDANYSCLELSCRHGNLELVNLFITKERIIGTPVF